jgi:hypothetical protein
MMKSRHRMSILLLAILALSAQSQGQVHRQIPLSGTDTAVEQADAVASELPPPQPEGVVYARASSSVFRVEASDGEGSGFLVDASGLVLTNFHVVRETRYIAVQIDEDSKVPAVLLARDEDNDLAVLRVHPDATAGLEPLRLRTEGEEESAIGERIMAIGFPLAQDSVLTTGVVGKIEPTTLITDANINPGNSGGPVLDLRGRVIGVATFGIQGESGPGVGGAVRSHVAQSVLNEARALLVDSEPPDARLLPIASRTPFPVDALRESLTWRRRPKDYHAEAGKFDIYVATPISSFHFDHWGEIKAAKRQAKRRKRRNATENGDLYDPAGDVFNWTQYTRTYEPVVSMLATPELKETGGSKAGRIFGAMFGVITPGKFKFKQDFRDMTLLRDGEAVEPILPGRACEAVSIKGYGRLNDVGCMGAYAYRPEEFVAQGSYQLIVTSEEEPDKPITVELDEELLERIRQDFALFFEGEPLDAAASGEQPSVAAHR